MVLIVLDDGTIFLVHGTHILCVCYAYFWFISFAFLWC